jgi:hypothetical protein
MIHRSEKYFEDGEQFGYYYQLVRGRIFWKGYFYTTGRRNRTPANIGLTLNKDKARKKLKTKISNYHYHKVEMAKRSYAKYGRFTT